MLVEALCRYKINIRQDASAISNIKFINCDDPLTDETYLVHSESKIPFFGNKILVFEADCKSSNVFEIEFESKENISFNYEKYAVDFISNVRSFQSIYPCTGVSAIFNVNGFDCILFEFSVKKKKDQIVSSLKKLKSGLYEDDGILYSSSETHPSYEKKTSKYVIKAEDGNIPVDIDILKRENLTGLYFNNNQDVSSIGNRYNEPISDDINKSIANAVNVIGSEKPLMDEISVDSINTVITNANPDTNINTSVEIVFEYFNDKSYVVLIKSFINEFTYSRFSYIKHCILDTLYFIFIKIYDEITVIVSKKLYNFIPLYNLMESIDCRLILNVPDLNPHTSSGYVQMIFDDKQCNFKYKIPDFECEKQIELIFKYSYVMVEETPRTFWFIAKIHELLFPMRFPGLILSPLISDMMYLMDGPYPFLISSNQVVELKDRPVFVCESPQWNTSRKTDHAIKKPKMMKKWTGKLTRQILTKLSYKNTSKLEIRSLTSKKQEYIRSLLFSKKIKDGIPDTFEAPTLIERCFLNESRYIPVRYSYNLDKNTVKFDTYNRMNMTDAVSLWLMIYKGPIDLVKLLNKRWIDLEFLCRRACIDNNVSVVRRILNRISNGSRMVYRGGIAVLARRKFLRWNNKPFNMNACSVLQSLNRNNKLYDISLYDINNKVNVSVDRKRYVTTFKYQNETFKLLKLEQIIACLEAKYINNQVYGSILAYLQYFRLSLDVSDQKETFKQGFRIYI